MKAIGIWLPALALLGIGWSLPRVVRDTGGRALAASGRVAGVTAPEEWPTPVATPPATARPREKSVRTAYRLLVDGDRVELMGREELHGHFKTCRGTPASLPGMLHCRLVAGDGRILAEETLAAPDRASLIPAAADLPATGRAAPRRPALCQVRLPQSADAVALEVRRVETGSTPPQPGALLARFDFPE